MTAGFGTTVIDRHYTFRLASAPRFCHGVHSVRTLSFLSKTFSADLAAFCRGSAVSREFSAQVAAILADVDARGDEAVGYYAAKFDGARLRARDFPVKPTELAAA